MNEKKEPAFREQATTIGNGNNKTQTSESQTQTTETEKVNISTSGILDDENVDVKILQSFTIKPPELDYIWHGFMAGSVGALTAVGSTGKSFWALEAAIALAAKTGAGDVLEINPPKHPASVLYIAAEDGMPAINLRLYAIAQYIDTSEYETINNNLTIKAMFGKRLNVMDKNHIANIIKHGMDKRLIIFDTLSRIHTLDENSNGDMGKLIANLGYIANQTGAGVLFLHHNNKFAVANGQGDQQQAVRGASALVDNIRYNAYLVKMSEQEAKSASIPPERRNYYIRFGTNKQSYGEIEPEQWYERQTGGVLVPRKLNFKSQGTKRGYRDEEETR